VRHVACATSSCHTDDPRAFSGSRTPIWRTDPPSESNAIPVFEPSVTIVPL
jgi:hypothetical protein